MPSAVVPGRRRVLEEEGEVTLAARPPVGERERPQDVEAEDHVRPQRARLDAGRAQVERGEHPLGRLELDADRVHVDDGPVDPDPVDLGRAHRLEAERPDLVYVPSFLEQHPDHYAASAILLEASRDFERSIQCIGYEVWTPLFPNCVVKIDEVVDVKRSALAEYRSQLAQTNYMHSGLGLNAYRAAAFNDNYGSFAEAFCSVSLKEYRAMFDAYRGAP